MLAKKLYLACGTALVLSTTTLCIKATNKSKTTIAYEKLLEKRAESKSKKTIAYENLLKKRNIQVKSPKKTKTDLYIKYPEDIFEEEIVPHLEAYRYDEEKKSKLRGIFNKNNKVVWESNWHNNYQEHKKIAERANAFITELNKKIAKHKKDPRYLNYLKSDDFKYQTWSEDLLEKIDNLVSFYNLRLNQYQKIPENNEVARLKTYITHRREELITSSKGYFNHTPIEYIKLNLKPEDIFLTEIAPLLKKHTASITNPDTIFGKKNVIIWENHWNYDYAKHLKIATKTNKFITGLNEKIIKHKINTLYLDYLKSDNLKKQPWPKDLLEKINNLVSFYNERLNQYPNLTKDDLVKRLTTYMTNRREELIKISKKYFDHTPIEKVTLKETK